MVKSGGWSEASGYDWGVSAAAGLPLNSMLRSGYQAVLSRVKRTRL